MQTNFVAFFPLPSHSGPPGLGAISLFKESSWAEVAWYQKPIPAEDPSAPHFVTPKKGCSKALDPQETWNNTKPSCPLSLCACQNAMLASERQI